MVASIGAHPTIKPWAFRELGRADFGDARLTVRALRLASDRASHPDFSLASLYRGDWAGLKAGYRFFDNDAVTAAEILAPHQQATGERCRREAWVLIAQDTTYFNFAKHSATTGLGPIGPGDAPGLLVHSAMAMTTAGVPLGIVAQMSWARDPALRGRSAQRKSRAIEDKESYRWIAVHKPVTVGLPAGIHTVLMGDREADIYDLFMAPRAPHQHLLVRGAWNRQLENPADLSLWAAVDAAPVVGTQGVTVPRKSGQPERTATLELRATAVRWAVPAHRPVSTPAAPQIAVVRAEEVNPPDGTDPICWVLLTTLPVVTADDARRIVTWYSYRWRIERFHYPLKSGGSQVERLQLETADRLKRAIALYSIIAWRIVWMTYQTRVDPDPSPSIAFTPEELEALRRVAATQSPALAPDQPLTLRVAVRTMANLGGFLGRRSDGEPGGKTLWRGYRELQLICWGMRLARSTP